MQSTNVTDGRTDRRHIVTINNALCVATRGVVKNRTFPPPIRCISEMTQNQVLLTTER